MRRFPALFVPVVLLTLLSSCAMEQAKQPYATAVPRTAVHDGICEYRVEGNLRDFIRPYLALEIRRHGPSPQPSLSGWVSLTRPDGEEAVKAPVQLLLLTSAPDKTHPDQMRDRYGTRLDLGLAPRPRTVWQKGPPPDATDQLSASVYLHTPTGLEDEMGQVAIDGRMYRSDVHQWKIARENKDPKKRDDRLVYDPTNNREPTVVDPLKKG